MTPPNLFRASQAIEALLVSRNHRGMAQLREALEPGYLARAVTLIRDCRGDVYIVTGFPVAGSFETDGPAGAIALYRLCEHLGLSPIIVSDETLTAALSARYRCETLQRGSATASDESVAARYLARPPALVISIERPGAAADGRYYNMAGRDISDACVPAEAYLKQAPCPTIAIGDGGNEIGMGKVLEQLTHFDIHPAVSTCDELVVADVSNWGAYAICAIAYAAEGQIPDMENNIRQDLADLVALGAVDGVTGEPTPTEDGLEADAGVKLMASIVKLLSETDER